MQEDLNSHFIKNIEIKNFKCFKDFKAEGFGRVNLIGGKNNVGKTAFMEACYINRNDTTLKSFTAALSDIKFMRENLNLLFDNTDYTQEFMEQTSGIIVNTNLSSSSFKIEDIDGVKKYIFEFNKQEVEVNIKEFSYESDYIENTKFIDSFGLSNNQIIGYYSAIQKKDEEKKLNLLLKSFDSRIEAFKIIDEKPQCKINESYLEITEFGDGVRHLISIITALYNAESGYLFIDEIDNGIHYTMLDELWKVIFNISDKLNVQVFATTHSKECIESYARVAKKLEDEDITFIKMTRLEDGSIMAGVRDYETLQYAVDDGHEVRGW